MLELKEFTKNLIDEKLSEKCPSMNYSIKYSSRLTKCLGRCQSRDSSYTKVTFTFNENYTKYCEENNLIEEFKDVVLHEIAHALTGYIDGRGHGHDWMWKLRCREVGANPTRLSDTEWTAPAKYIYVCPKCGKRIERATKWRINHACKDCCTKYGNGKYSEEFKFTLKEVA